MHCIRWVIILCHLLLICLAHRALAISHCQSVSLRISSMTHECIFMGNFLIVLLNEEQTHRNTPNGSQTIWIISFGTPHAARNTTNFQVWKRRLWAISVEVCAPLRPTHKSIRRLKQKHSFHNNHIQSAICIRIYIYILWLFVHVEPSFLFYTLRFGWLQCCGHWEYVPCMNRNNSRSAKVLVLG